MQNAWNTTVSTLLFTMESALFRSVHTTTENTTFHAGHVGLLFVLVT